MLLKNPWKLQINGESGSATDVTFVSHAVDDNGSALSNIFLTGTINGTTWVDAVQTPASGDRLVRYVEIVNTGSVNHDVGLRVSDGSTSFGQRAYTITPSGSIRFVANSGWEVLEANGAIKSAVLAGSNGSILYNNAGVTGGAASVQIQSDALALVSLANPPAASSSTVKMFANSHAGRVLPAYIGPVDQLNPLQPHMGHGKMAMWLPPGNATTVPVSLGIAAPTATGTATARNVATTNIVTQSRRLGYVSAATAGSLSGYRNAAAQYFRGGGANLGGFHMMTRFVPSDAATVAGARMFVGLWATTTAPTNVETDTLVNIIGVGSRSTDSNLQVFYNDGAGTASNVDLGANFPANGLSSEMFEFSLYCEPNASAVTYRVENFINGATATGTLDTNIPVSTTLLGFQAYRSNNATALAVGIDLVSLYIETNY